MSGSEIYSYFAKYGIFGYLGVFVFFVLISFVLYKILNKTMQIGRNIELKNSGLNNGNRINNIISKSRTNIIFNQNKINTNNVKLQKIRLKIYKIVVFLNVLMFSGAMLSGLKNFTKNLFNYNYLWVFFCIIFSVFILLLMGINWLKKVDYFVIIFVIFLLFCIIFNFKIANFEEDFPLINGSFLQKFYENFAKNKSNLLASIVFPVLYVFTNMFQIQPLIESSGVRLNSKKECKLFSIIFAEILSFIVIIFVLFLNKNNEFGMVSMPFLEYFKSKNGIIRSVYIGGLLFALITTFVSCLIGVKQKVVEKLKFSNFSATIFAYFLAISIGFLPYKIFIEIVYPVIGLLNLLIFVFCL